MSTPPHPASPYHHGAKDKRSSFLAVASFNLVRVPDTLTVPQLMDTQKPDQ